MGTRVLAAVLTAATAILPFLAGEARAANNGYAVDAADISETGSCKIESWLSSATNTDFSAFANPSCVVDPFKLKPVELSLLTNRARSDGEWSTSFAPKAKMNLVPTGVGKLGVSFYAAAAFDAATGENLTMSAVIPATYRLSETMRININGGWLWDRTIDHHFVFYGAQLRLEVHRYAAMDHRGLRPGRLGRYAEHNPAAFSDRRALPPE